MLFRESCFERHYKLLHAISAFAENRTYIPLSAGDPESTVKEITEKISRR
jgi:hypothetical protein